MIEINRRVLDLSHHNSVSSWTQVVDAGIVGIIHKATEGTSYVDDTYYDRRKSALQNGLQWGAYHFANGNDVAKQVDHFLGIVGVDDYTLYALDWEEEPHGNTMSLDQAREFLELVDAEIGQNRCVLYSGNLAKEKLGMSHDAFFGSHRLWLAQYGETPSWQTSWDSYWLWQYSDGVHGPSPRGCPGCTGDVDTNHWDGGDEELIAEWAGFNGAPAPGRATIEIVCEGDVVIRVNGKLIVS